MIERLIELYNEFTKEEFKLLLNIVKEDVQFGESHNIYYTDAVLKEVIETSAVIVRSLKNE